MSRKPLIQHIAYAGSQLRRRWLGAVVLLPLVATLPRWAQPAGACKTLSDWASFAARHIQADGRVVDFDTPQQQSTSEGQAYALFFALVHNDSTTFDRVLSWTETNLCAGSLAARLPAWQWGNKPDNTWGVLDENSASDADLWAAYALLEAGRLWEKPQHHALGRAVMSMVARDEVCVLAGLGRMLLPWPQSAAQGPAWRLNPSYMPLQLLRRFHIEDPEGPWSEIADNTVRLLSAVTPRGFAPDWCVWSTDDTAFGFDTVKGAVGSYDAIRIYLWAGLLNARDPARSTLLKCLYGPRRALEQGRTLAEYVDTATGLERGDGPFGYVAALLPYLKAQNLTAQLNVQLARLRARTTPIVASVSGPSFTKRTAPLPYYERMLILFGQSWLEGRFTFGRTGQLQTNWRLSCP